MCGRYASTLSGEELGHYFHADEIADVELRPSWNIAPTTNVPIVVEKRDDRGLQYRHVIPTREFTQRRYTVDMDQIRDAFRTVQWS